MRCIYTKAAPLDKLPTPHGSASPWEKIPEPQSIYYTSHDGRKIPANIYRPVGEPEGTVVYLHGGPESQDRPEFKPLVAAMLASGLLVAAPTSEGALATARRIYV